MSDNLPKVEVLPLTSAIPDPDNANLHTQRGQGMLERSLQQRGFFRPIAAAGKGTPTPVVKAGNLTQEAALNSGMDEAIFIYTDGSRPIVHVREDLDPDSPEATQLAIEDNRIAEVSLDYSPAILEQIYQAHGERLDESGLFEGDELATTIALARLRQGIEFSQPPSGETPPQPLLIKIVITQDDQIEEIAAGIAQLIRSNAWDAELL